MEILYYFDERGNPFKATKTDTNSDKTINLEYSHRDKTHTVNNVPPKDKATLIKSHAKDKKKTLASKFFKIVERPDNEKD